MNIVAALVALLSVLSLAVAFACLIDTLLQAIRASRSHNREQETVHARALFGLIVIILCVGSAGFTAFTAPATYDVARYPQMSRREQKPLERNLCLGLGAMVYLGWYASQRWSARRQRRSDEAVARAIEDWKANHKHD
jgi:O-antigen/teichoic acid export membrane protein